MNLARFPRIRLAHLPTPIEHLPRLSEALGPEIWIKRDDCTGLSTGGNKTRKLEFLMAEGRDAVEPRAPDGGGGSEAGPRLPHPAGGSDGLHA
jgi:hypothetical protein